MAAKIDTVGGLVIGGMVAGAIQPVKRGRKASNKNKTHAIWTALLAQGQVNDDRDPDGACVKHTIPSNVTDIGKYISNLGTRVRAAMKSHNEGQEARNEADRNYFGLSTKHVQRINEDKLLEMLEEAGVEDDDQAQEWINANVEDVQERCLEDQVLFFLRTYTPAEQPQDVVTFEVQQA